MAIVAPAAEQLYDPLSLLTTLLIVNMWSTRGGLNVYLDSSAVIGIASFCQLITTPVSSGIHDMVMSSPTVPLAYFAGFGVIEIATV